MMSFYETLAIAMREKGLTAAELSRRSGVYPSYITNLKKGTAKDATWSKALALIDALGMTPSEFYALQVSEDER